MTGVSKPFTGPSAWALDILDTDDAAADSFLNSRKDKLQVDGGGDVYEGDDKESLPSLLTDWPSLDQVNTELWRLLDLSVPCMGLEVVLQLRMVISVVLLGHLGQSELAVGSLAISFADITVYSILTGLGSSMEPLCAQAFGGQHYKFMGYTLQRTILLLLAACFPMALLWGNAETLLLLAGQDPTLSRLAGRYLLHMLPDLMATSFLDPLATYLRCQGVTRPIVGGSFIALLLHVPINILFMHNLGFGLMGNAIANFLFTFNLLIFLVLFTHLSGSLKGRWPGLSQECFRGWGPLLKLAAPSCLAVCLEWWLYEIMVFLAGLLPDPETAVSSITILTQLAFFSCSFSFGLGASASTLVGTELGANNPRGARRVTLVTVSASSLAGSASALIFFLFRDKLGQIFTSDAAVLQQVPALFILLSLSEVFNWMQATIIGVLRGSARPFLSSTLYFVCYHVIGLSLSIYFAFHLGEGLRGLWGGFIIANVVLVACGIPIMASTDWVLQTCRAQRCIQMEHGEIAGRLHGAIPIPEDDAEIKSTEQEDGSGAVSRYLPPGSGSRNLPPGSAYAIAVVSAMANTKSAGREDDGTESRSLRPGRSNSLPRGKAYAVLSSVAALGYRRWECKLTLSLHKHKRGCELAMTPSHRWGGRTTFTEHPWTALGIKSY